MEAHDKSLTFIKGPETRYIIPYFQRGYVWTKDNWEQFLSEMLNDNSSHFIGSFITKQMEKDEHFYRYNVIDGQQRMTTLSILCRAIYDVVDDEKKQTIKETIFSFLFVQKDSTEGWKPENIDDKLVPGINDKEAYHKIINYPDMIDTIEEDNGLRKCYEYFLSELDEEKASKIIKRINNSEIKFAVQIDLHEKDNEQAIFDATNSTGVKLTCADIIKNDLFYKFDESKREKIYKDTWEKVFDGEDYNYWLESYNKRSNIENLLFAISEMEIKNTTTDESGNTKINYIFDPYNDTYDMLANKYKEYFKEKVNQDGEIKKFLDRLIKYAKIYKNYFVTEIKAYRESEYVPRFFLILNKLNISTVLNPYLLRIFDKYADQNGEIPDDKLENLKKELFKIEVLLIRANILNKVEFADDKYKPSNKNFNKSIKEVLEFNNIERLYTSEQISSIKDDAKIKLGLKKLNGNHNTAAIIIFILTLKMNASLGRATDIQAFEYNYELEHIMPQSPKEHWGLYSSVDGAGNDVSSKPLEEREQIRSEHIGQIGNMMIITPELNKKIKNFNIEIKMKGDATHKKRNGEFSKGYYGYEDCSNGPFSKEVKDSIISSGCVWNEKMISERTVKLINDILKCWPSF